MSAIVGAVVFSVGNLYVTTTLLRLITGLRQPSSQIGWSNGDGTMSISLPLSRSSVEFQPRCSHLNIGKKPPHCHRLCSSPVKRKNEARTRWPRSRIRSWTDFLPIIESAYVRLRLHPPLPLLLLITIRLVLLVVHRHLLIQPISFIADSATRSLR